jgi:transcriptional regulator with XRE-family HTH domain
MKQETFKTLRAIRRQTVKEVAEQIGVGEGTYRKYESSARLPTVPVVLKMIEAYHCTPEELIEACKHHYGIRETKK